MIREKSGKDDPKPVAVKPPSFRRERALIKLGIWPVAGCAEAGRGPRAGPVAAASLIARLTRGRVMCALSQEGPGYGCESQTGYSVPEQLEARDRLGPTVHHRRFLAPVIAPREKHQPWTVKRETDLFSVAA